MSPSIFPPDDAGPRQIRQYLVDHLMSKHDATLEFAQTIADLWQLGRGVDFRQTTVSFTEIAMKKYIAIFGDQVAPYLLRSVREECWNQWRASILGTTSLRTIVACIALSTLLCIRTLTSDKYHAGSPFAYVFRNACFPIGPPMLICGYLEYGYSPFFFILILALGIYGTIATFISSGIVYAYEEDQRTKEGVQGKEKE